MTPENTLICPACKTELIRIENSFKCTNNKCIHSTTDNFYRCFGGVPVLVSEEMCDTVCSSSNVRSLIMRSGDGGRLKFLKKHIVGESNVTKSNISNFVKLLMSSGTNKIVLIIGSGEIGSGTNDLYTSPIEIVGTDVYISPSVDYVSDAHYLPFKDCMFDGVLIQAVLEHVVNPNLVVSEIHRVLKKDGILYAETPFMQQVHEGAYDFTRYTVLGHRYLFKNFEKISSGGLDGVGVVLAWSIRAFIHAIIRSRIIAKIIFVPVKYILSYFDKIADPKSFHDANSGSFFLGKRTVNSITHKELIKEYKGWDK